jgi:multiple sugar transport system substrate-binding protein
VGPPEDASGKEAKRFASRVPSHVRIERGAGSVKYHKSWKAPVLAVLFVVAGTSLAACGGDSGSPESKSTAGKGSGPVPEPTKPVTITFESWVGGQPEMKKLATEFHKEHPMITVKFINASADTESQKLTTQIAGNEAPDSAYVNASDTSDFASRGALVNLDDYISRSDVVNPDDYVDAFKTFVTYDDSMWGLPFDGESTGLFYRKDLFAAAGIDHPPTTWEEFEADAAKLTVPSKDQYGFEIFASESAYYWYPWLYQAGGDLLSEDGKQVIFNSEAAKQAADFYVNLAKYSPPDYYNSNSYDGRVAFENGNVAMYVAGSWLAGTIHSEKPDIDDKWTTAPLPNGEAGCKTTIAGDSLIMFDQSKNPDATWKWLEFLSKPENIAEWTYKSPNGTELPPLSSLLNSPDLVKTKPVLEGFAKLMDCGVASTVSQPKFPRVEQILNTELGKAIYGDQTADQAIDTAAQQGQAILNR